MLLLLSHVCQLSGSSRVGKCQPGQIGSKLFL
jgi:hypothetical protein